MVLAHLGQSLDGHIALSCGASRWITGIDDRVHNQRLRALFDAVLVGAGTVIADDPRLTVREVAGPSPVRVVVEGRRPIPINRRVFKDGQAPTVVVTGRPVSQAAADYPGAEVLQVAGDGDQARPQPHAVLDALFAAGLTRVFIEGGGAIISTFLAAGCLDRLQLTVAPVITGGGRPALCLPEAPSLDDALRPRTRIFQLGPDVLFDCELTRARP